MEIKKINLNHSDGRLLYTYPENTSLGDELFRIGFSVDAISKDSEKAYGGGDVSGYHMLLDGSATSTAEEIKTLAVGDTCISEENQRLSVRGQGHLFNMLMFGGIRGFIRTLILDQEKKERFGEGVGTCVVAFFSLDSGFSLVCGEQTYRCEQGTALVVQLKNREFVQLKFIPDKSGMRLAAASAVVLSNNDFGKFLGVKFLERGQGTCKTRLDIRPEHMNPINTVHGGCLFTLADATCGVAASSVGSICTTVSSNIQFLNAAFSPKYLIAEAKPKKLGRKVRIYLVEIWDDKGTLICTVDFVFYSLQQ